MFQRAHFIVLALILFSCRAPAAGPTTAPADAAIDDALDKLDQSGKTLADFSAHLTLTHTDNISQLETSHSGMIWYQNQADAGGRVHVVFDSNRAGKVTDKNKTEYLLDGSWLWDRDYAKKIQIKRQVAKPGQKIDLLKLGQGPFPLPIGQDKADVHKQFDVALVPAAAGDPPGTLHLSLTPKPRSPLARKFAVIDVWMDTRTNMPVRIDTGNLSNTETDSTVLTDIQVNKHLTDAQFKLQDIDGWNQRDEPYEQ